MVSIERGGIMYVDNLEDLGAFIVEQAKNGHFNLGGPASFDWGYDGGTNISFWHEDRRVHFYFQGMQGRIYILAEAAEVGPPKKVLISRIQSEHEAWEIVAKFLRSRCAFEDLPGDEWVSDAKMTDDRIPHPPGETPRIGEVKMDLVGGLPEVKPAPAAEPSRPRPPQAAKPASDAGVVGIGSLTLYSNDPAALSAWYGKVLGLVFTEQGGVHLASLGKEGMAFSIYKSEVPIPEGARPVMVNLRVSNFDSFVASMVEKGGELLGVDQTSLGKFAWTKDADGNPLEIWGN
jgi:predicted enzyme related to lactoylglutathione lyase